MEMASGFDGHVPKRQRMDDGTRAYGDNQNVDKHNPEVSPVVHVRGIPEFVTEDDILNAVQHFGQVQYVMIIMKRHQALVEFSDVKGSSACVNFARTNQLCIGGQPAFFNYSTSQNIQRPSGHGMEDGRPIGSPNKILLFTVVNAKYPITVDVMHTICSPHGRIDKIVIFKKQYVQALVQFDNVDSAKAAKEQLQGCDIYSGCCTLRVEFAKTNELNVRYNNTESWDYTVPNIPQEPQIRKNAPLLADPRFAPAPTPYGEFDEYADNRGPNPRPSTGCGYGGQYDQDDNFDQGYGQGGRGVGGGLIQSRPAGGYGQEPHGRGGVGMQQDRGGYCGGPRGGFVDQSSMAVGPGAPPQQGCVVMVYGLDAERMNCDRVFNIFCIYGNVVRVKFLKSKEGVAMVQLGDTMAVDRVIANLNGVLCFGKKITIHLSKQLFLQEVASPHDLPDGTSSFKDFTGNRNNRFFNPEQMSKNRIVHPTEILHFFNAPPKITSDEVKQLFFDAGAKVPTKLLQFPSKSEKSSSGLVEWDSKSDAIEALALTNHVTVPNPGGRPYVMKLCFSPSNIRELNK